MVNLSLDKADIGSSATERRSKWGRSQIGDFRYLLLRLCVICQALTVLLTWPLWQVRTDPPLLPLVDFPFQFSFGLILLFSLLYVLLDPRRGLIAHLVVLVIASCFDQMRMQPQFLATWMMMFATVSDIGIIIARWFLVSMWLWAGLHKILSPDWLGMQSWTLVERAGGDGDSLYLAFAVFVATSEITAGLIGIFKPRWAMVTCPALHIGIILFLSPIFINWNLSVVPWNFCTAIVGAWIMWETVSILPKTRLELSFAAAFLILPAGFYFGLMDHGYANVLYSDNLPKAVITTTDGAYEITGWGKLRVPFPNERRLLRSCFRRVAKIGDKMHLHDPRSMLSDQFLQLDESEQLTEISRDKFFSNENGTIRGVAYDDETSIFKLGFGGARLLKRDEGSAIYAIEFQPDLFTPDLLNELSGLLNIEQIQLAGCNVGDEDLKKLTGLKLLAGIGLNGTEVTDSGIVYLRKLPNLHTVECEDTQITGEGLSALFFD